ncbi:hypothetical protein [Jiella sonneratiae]|uniref:Uncharacterized protein n=1 Tax=Jiella sonneratiae TaxID=2816856 RepID=A0ABS3IY23_9HYPH|nr:hypothetical protein [Jiella sonneratiae]MBO0902300.1 hypothetical protein [Jiella sonneratiae]
MSNAPDKFDNQQNRADEQDRDQDMSYRQNAPKARPSEDNPFDRPGSVDRLGGEAERRPAESVAADEDENPRN